MSESSRNPEFEPDSQDPGTLIPPAVGGTPSFLSVDYGAANHAPAEIDPDDEDFDDEALDELDDGEPEYDDAPPDAAAEAEDEEADDADDSNDAEDNASSGPGLAAKLTSSLGGLARAGTIAGKQGAALAKRYPRACLASGLSAAILGGVVTLRPGQGPHDTTTQIKNPAAQAATAAKGQPNPEEPPPAVASNEKPGPHADAKSDAAPTVPAPEPDAAALASKGEPPAPAPSQEAPADPVKLTAGEKPEPLASTIDPAPASELAPIEPAGDKLADQAAPPLPPIGELAQADIKPGTSPTPVPVADPAPAPELALQPTEAAPVAVDPAPTASKDGAPDLAGGAVGAAAGAAIGAAASNAPEPTPAPSVATTPVTAPTPLDPSSAPAPALATEAAVEPKSAPTDVRSDAGGVPAKPLATGAKAVAGVAGSAAKGTTTKAALLAGGLGAGLGAAVAALSHSDKDKPAADKDKPTAQTQEPAPSTPIPAVQPAPAVAEPGPEHTNAPVTPSVIAADEPKPAPVAAAAGTGAVVSATAGNTLPKLHPAEEPARGTEGSPGAGPAPVATSVLERPSRPAETNPRDELAKQGWVSIKHTGNETVRDVQRDFGNEDQPVAGGRDVPSSAVDPRSPDDREKEPAFEAEAPPIAIAGVATANNTRGSRDKSEGKLDTVLHRVESGENFWTISRMYYNSGRYYKALWKANAREVPRIDGLHVDTVIRVPPPEDLDAAYIDPPGSHSARPRSETAAAAVGRDEDPSARRAAQSDGVPIRRARRADAGTDAALALPVSDAGNGDKDDSTAFESSTGPREPVSRPVYKVRPYETLRSIARDTMGDSHRADEILELNRDLIRDPSRLIVGQLLELPEDARPGRSRGRK